MDTPVLVALIGAAGMVFTGAITVILTRIMNAQNAEHTRSEAAAHAAHPKAAAHPPVTPDVSDHEKAMRQDARIQRLLNNINTKDIAEAAIAYFARGTECSRETWKKSPAWQHVKVVFLEVLSQATTRTFPRL
jgi:hypothetical protein